MNETDVAVATPQGTWSGFVVDEYPGYSKVVGQVDLDEVKARLKAGERILWDDGDTEYTADEKAYYAKKPHWGHTPGHQVRHWRHVSWPNEWRHCKKGMSFNSYWGSVKGRKDGRDVLLPELAERLRKAGRLSVQEPHHCRLKAWAEAPQRTAEAPAQDDFDVLQQIREEDL